MADTVVKETVEIAEPESKPEAPKAPTRDELKTQGWSAKELDAAEKRGMIQKDEKKPEPKPKEEAREAPKVEEKVEAKTTDVDAKVKAGQDLTADEEKEFLKNRAPGNQDRAFYFRAINERRARQDMQRQRDAEKAARVALEARIAALEKGGKTETEVDENGNAIDPEDKPLTEKRLKEIERARAEEAEKKNREQGERAAVVMDAQKAQEEFARGIYPDFDDTVKRAAEVMQNLEALVPEKWKQAKVAKLVRDLQVAAANADQYDPEGFNAAHIAYEIGQLHPDHGKSNGAKPTETGTPKDPKANGGLTPEQMKRIEENSRRGTSSASIPGGGGKRTIAVEDVGLAELNLMSFAERQAFRTKHPERYAKLLRG